jgi:hypothetical protein
MAKARLIALPFYHHGMHEVLPVGAKLPRRGRTVLIIFGEAFDCDEAYAPASGGRAQSEAPANDAWSFWNSQLQPREQK